MVVAVIVVLVIVRILECIRMYSNIQIVIINYWIFNDERNLCCTTSGGNGD